MSRIKRIAFALMFWTTVGGVEVTKVAAQAPHFKFAN